MQGLPTGPGGKQESNLDRLLEHERQYLDEARRVRKTAREESAPVDPAITSPQRELCGLALSGGGIRSATFNLGLLQCLQQMGLLEIFDYVATVSGGGYIGGFWTAWRHYHPHEADPRTGGPQLFPMTEAEGARGAHLREVQHLREFSNFLNPRLGLTSLDTGRLIVAALSALVPSLLAALSFIVLGLLLWLVLARFLLLGWPDDTPPPVALPVSYALMLLVTCGGLFLWEWRMARQNDRVKSVRDSQDTSLPDTQEREAGRFGYYLNATLLALGVVFVLWSWLVHAHHPQAQEFHGVWLRGTPGDMRWRERLYVFSPALALLGAAGALVVLRWFGSRFTTAWMQRTERAAVDRVISRLLLMAVFWSAISVLWLAGRLLRELILTQPSMKEISTWIQTGLVGAVMALSTVFAKVQQLFSRRTNKPVSPDMKKRAGSHLPQVLAYTILSLTVLGMVLLVLRAGDEGWLPWLVTSVVGLTVFTLLFFDANLVGLHAFYRDRIARTFIGAAHGEGPGQTEPHTKDDFPLDRLEPQPGPLHLVCCAANDLASEDPMANLYRGADSAVLSSVGFSVGSEWKSWKDIRHERGNAPTFVSAMTASAAAFNSHMGSLSMRLGPAVTFLMTALNLRLGLWWPHPTRARRRWYERLCVGLPFYKELLGRSRARGRDVLLSDGGHFENLALYELVRRKCRFILVSDCGMDSDTSFDDFANAVRRVREDFGVEIRIDLSPLHPKEDTGLSLRTVIAGDIEYPDGDSGVLLLIKPSLMGNEPPDITQYKARNPAFPHESTGDQFYDEAQWEAYRRLGEHAALTAFRPIRGEENLERGLVTARLFARARYEWLPVPTGFEERFSRLVERATALDLLLEGEGARRLFREVFKEVNELDLQAKQPHGPAPKPVPPTPEELADALHMIRRALLFMEEVFLTEDLATYYNHPSFMGLINYFARWAYAPLLRMWWPLLKTLYSPRFTQFLEERFSLPAMESQDVGRLSPMREGFAMSCWREQGGRSPHEATEQLISYALELPYGREPLYHVQAAQLIVRTHSLEGRPLVCDAGVGRNVVVWQGDDFYVPPGLWGAGIGEDFLRLLTTDRYLLEWVEPGSLQVVRLQVDRDATAARRKRWSDDVQLYRSHGFSEPRSELRQWLSELEPELDRDAAMRWTRKQGERWRSYWLTRIYQPREEAAARPGGRPEAEQPLHH